MDYFFKKIFLKFRWISSSLTSKVWWIRFLNWFSFINLMAFSPFGRTFYLFLLNLSIYLIPKFAALPTVCPPKSPHYRIIQIRNFHWTTKCPIFLVLLSLFRTFCNNPSLFPTSSKDCLYEFRESAQFISFSDWDDLLVGDSFPHRPLTPIPAILSNLSGAYPNSALFRPKHFAVNAN